MRYNLPSPESTEFRFPGTRSDSDMFTLGYSLRPWQGDRSIADGPAILNYLCETT
jgi:monooxygenase